MDIGSLIKKEIKKQNKTQKEVAERIGISTNSISQICKGEVFPHKKTLEKICNLLNIKIQVSIGKKLITLEEANRQRLNSTNGELIPNGIACPECGQELVDTDNSRVLMSHPAKTSIQCISCNFKSTRFV